MHWVGGEEKGLIKTLESNLVLKINARHKELKGRERQKGGEVSQRECWSSRAPTGKSCPKERGFFKGVEGV